MIKLKDIKNCKSFIEVIGHFEDDHALSISTDSRQYEPESLFVAISGESFNALEFLDGIVEKQCKYVVYSKSNKNDQLINNFRDKLTFIAVEDSVVFLQDIAKLISQRFQENGGKLIAITGSNGKTTTKEMLYQLLHGINKNTICTQKNNNNHIGVPLTIFQINANTKYGIIEFGSNHPGEIKTLCTIGDPAIGVTTNIGDTHLEFFGDREAVYEEEGYLANWIASSDNSNKRFFVNLDDEYLNAISGEHTISYGESKDADCKLSFTRDSVTIDISGVEYVIENNNITGKHNFINLALAFIMAKEVAPNETDKFLKLAKEFEPTNNRSQWLKLGTSKIFLDAYNANPSSMRMAINGFHQKIDSKKDNYCLVVGDMNELGVEAQQYHALLGEEICKEHKSVFFVGRYAQDYVKYCGDKGEKFENIDSFKKYFQQNLIGKYEYIFIKGSRSLQLESLMDIN